ncbi:Translation factor guf1 mitochondrial [Puccinia graminis f. sp. tritici]|uniref:Translation factor guf1 mitochondrial n=1 Tax=Puccinia graminis f. sp. tritici TaxID=56615 RepID=A0A5B0MVK0_PUCGR|nr:Translation factor guf1 mitochondrial [Puccinia graminis f. sp. tritici]
MENPRCLIDCSNSPVPFYKNLHLDLVFIWASSLSSRSPMKRSKRPTILGDTLYAAKTLFAQIHPVNRSMETRQLMVFAGLYPIDSNAFDCLADAIQRLVLNDWSATINNHSTWTFYGYDRMINMPSRSGLNRRSICGGRIVVSKGTTWMVEKPVDFPSVRNRADGVKVIERIIYGTIIVTDRFTGPAIGLCSVEQISP